METFVRILIADPSEEFRRTLSEVIGGEEDMLVVGMCSRENQLLPLVEQTQPDVILLDTELSGLDSETVLEQLSRREPFPKVVVLSQTCREELFRAGLAVGFVQKPCIIPLLLTQIRQAVGRRCTLLSINGAGQGQRQTAQNLEFAVSDVLHEIGVPAHLKGYQYVREAIVLAVNDMDVINAITKILYPAVAKKFESTPSRVERSIRNAIETAWNRGNVDVIQKMFGYTISTTKGKPTNSEFIAMIADSLILRSRWNVL
jgi:two-component system response regulator (stage 0 sporulation protein A)